VMKNTQRPASRSSETVGTWCWCTEQLLPNEIYLYSFFRTISSFLSDGPSVWSRTPAHVTDHAAGSINPDAQGPRKITRFQLHFHFHLA
jgi:hypothetical protein